MQFPTSPTERAVFGRARRAGPSLPQTCRKTDAVLSENNSEFFICLAKFSVEHFSVAADLKNHMYERYF